MTTSLPEKIGKYTITRSLGHGAMGMVYAGHDPLIDRTVAIKVINKTSFDDEELQEAMDRFKREAQAAGKLNHTNIVMVYEYGEEEDTAFISMEYVEGRTLHEIMARDSLTISQVQDFMVQLLDGLDYAHSHKVTHRDIKPANLVYTKAGQIKIMDFGIAKVESSTLTQVGTIMGTPAYMAPELFTGEPVDHRADLFSAAVILYQLLTGMKPFTGSTMSIIMHQVVNVHPPHPSEVNSKLPKRLDSLLRQSLSKNLSNRFQSATEFKKELLQAFKKIPVQTKLPRQTTANPTDQTIINKKTTSAQAIKRQLKPVYFIGAGLLILLTVTLLYFTSRSGEQQTALEPEDTTISATTTPERTLPPDQTTIKIISPESKKITRKNPSAQVKQPAQRTGISINSRRDTTDENPSGSGIRITTPSRD